MDDHHYTTLALIVILFDQLNVGSFWLCVSHVSGLTYRMHSREGGDYVGGCIIENTDAPPSRAFSALKCKVYYHQVSEASHWEKLKFPDISV